MPCVENACLVRTGIGDVEIFTRNTPFDKRFRAIAVMNIKIDNKRFKTTFTRGNKGIIKKAKSHGGVVSRDDQGGGRGRKRFVILHQLRIASLE